MNDQSAPTVAYRNIACARRCHRHLPRKCRVPAPRLHFVSCRELSVAVEGGVRTIRLGARCLSARRKIFGERLTEDDFHDVTYDLFENRYSRMEVVAYRVAPGKLDSTAVRGTLETKKAQGLEALGFFKSCKQITYCDRSGRARLMFQLLC